MPASARFYRVPSERSRLNYATGESLPTPSQCFMAAPASRLAVRIVLNRRPSLVWQTGVLQTRALVLSECARLRSRPAARKQCRPRSGIIEADPAVALKDRKLPPFLGDAFGADIGREL